MVQVPVRVVIPVTELGLLLAMALGVGLACFPPQGRTAPRAMVSIGDTADPYEGVPFTSGFDFPIGPPDAEGYYDAQPFGTNHHLGEDWNGVGGGDTDLGDPVVSMAAGRVEVAEDAGGGWCGVVRVVHRLPDGRMMESLYAHVEDIAVEPGEIVRRGQLLGTMGNCNGIYAAHLHLELRDAPGMSLGGGYSRDTYGWVAPTPFIEAHRPARDGR